MTIERLRERCEEAIRQSEAHALPARVTLELPLRTRSDRIHLFGDTGPFGFVLERRTRSTVASFDAREVLASLPLEVRDEH